AAVWLHFLGTAPETTPRSSSDSLAKAVLQATSGPLSDSFPKTPRLIPFTTDPGRVYQPAFSADGKWIPYSWEGAQRDNFDIYVRRIGTDTPMRLTAHAADDGSPVWSPDGGQIAFVRYDAGKREGGIFVKHPVPDSPETFLCSQSLPVRHRFDTQLLC